MTEILGHSKFAAHGGDWGALVTAHMAHAHPDVLIGAHMSLTLIPGIDRALIGREAYAENEQWMIAPQSGSAAPDHKSSCRPPTRSTNIGLCSDRFHPWAQQPGSGSDGANGATAGEISKDVFDRDHLCNTAALYWCTGAIASSLRLYHEHFKKPWPLVHTAAPYLKHPADSLFFLKMLCICHVRTLAAQCNLKQYSLMPQGGHFGAAEQPELLLPTCVNSFTTP